MIAYLRKANTQKTKMTDDPAYRNLHKKFLAESIRRGMKQLRDCVTQDDYALAIHLWKQLPPMDQAIYKLSHSQEYQNYCAAKVIYRDRQLFIDSQGQPHTPVYRLINRTKIGPKK